MEASTSLHLLQAAAVALLLFAAAAAGADPAASKPEQQKQEELPKQPLKLKRKDLPRRTDQGVELVNGTFKFTDIDVFYRMMDSGDKEDPVILFLHGRSFTSDVWPQLNSMKLAWDMRYKAVAVDLPGFGNTPHLPYVDNNMRAEFIKACLDYASGGRNLTAVLVVPSMSGKWAIPFLDRYGQMLGGVIMLAPVGVDVWGGPWEFTHKQVHLLALYGERDPMKKDANYLLKLFLNSRQSIIKDAGHACYVDQPDEWHTQLQGFLQKIDPEARVEDVFKKQGE